jgi:hypothetical protein
VRDQVACRLIQGGDNILRSVAQKDPRMGAESFGAADLALLVHEDDGFILRIEAKPAGANAIRRHSLLRACRPVPSTIHASSTF